MTNIAVAREGLATLDKTPLGQIAKKDATTCEAVNALFPRDPVVGSAGEVAATVKALAEKRPQVAERLVRVHAETVFNAATRNLVNGPNEFGGAKFSAMLTGNAEQAASLEAAVRALPNGASRWDGFRKFLDVMEATGQRQRMGSMTAFNQEIQQSLKAGTAIGDIRTAVSTGGTSYLKKIREGYDHYRLGKNTEELARIITDPANGLLFRTLAREAAGSSKAQVMTLHLLAKAQQGRAAVAER